MSELVLVRHGQSLWNLENRFTGWTDVDLTEQGIEEARTAGRLLKEGGYVFDIAFTSLQKRAIRTLWMILDEMDLMWIPVRRDWRLNERHYGALQGLNKAATAEEFGEQQVQIWRRSYDTPPPPLELSDPRYPGHDPRYHNLRPEEIPRSESLKDTVHRFQPCWENLIVPTLRAKRRVLIVSHGNSLRSLVKQLDNLSDQEIVGLNIPTGIPLVYSLESDLKPSGHRYLCDPEELSRRTASVVNQGKAP